MDRVIYVNYAQGAHLQDPWWAGFNDARNGWDYNNGYATVTARYEYQRGYACWSGDAPVPFDKINVVSNINSGKGRP